MSSSPAHCKAAKEQLYVSSLGLIYGEGRLLSCELNNVVDGLPGGAAVRAIRSHTTTGFRARELDELASTEKSARNI